MTHRDMLAKIHIARKDLGLEDGDYRAMLIRITGADSAKALSDAQANDVIAEMKRLGWTPKAATKKQAERPDVRKIYAIWGALHSGELDRKALRTWVRNRFGVSAPEFLKPPGAREAIEQLKAWQKRLRGQE